MHLALFTQHPTPDDQRLDRNEMEGIVEAHEDRSSASRRREHGF
jgi:hypothetical protein